MRCAAFVVSMLVTLPVWAAPELQGVEPLPAPSQGVVIKAQEGLTYEVRPTVDKALVLLLKGATLGQTRPAVLPTNFGSVILNQSTEGVTVRLTFTQPDTTYQFQPSDENRTLTVQLTTKGQPVAQAQAQLTTTVPAKPVERFTLKARSQEVRDTLTLLSRISRTSIVTSPEVQSKVTLNLENATFEDALKSVVALANLQFRREGEVYVVFQRPPNPQGGPASDDGIKDIGDPRPRSPDDDPGDRLVSIIANDTELSRVLKEMANQANVELILTGQINEQVSVRLVNRTFTDALEQLLAGTTFGYSRAGNVYRVGDATPGTPTSKAFSTLKVFRLSNSKVRDLFDQLPPSLAALSQGIKIDEPRNALIVSGPPSFVTQIASIIKELDTPIPTVSFGVKIVELTESGSQDYRAVAAYLGGGDTVAGVTGQDRRNLLGVFANDPFTVLLLNNFQRILTTVGGLIQSGKGRLVTDTKVTAISGQTTAIDVSQQVNFTLSTAVSSGSSTVPSQTLQTINVPTTVQITPTVQADGNVFTDIQIQASSTSAPTVAVPGDTVAPPNLNSRRVASKVLLRDGETIEIGGLIQNQSTETRSRLPIIGYIPFIGDLFSSTNRIETSSELLVFVTAYINRRPTQPPIQEAPVGGTRLDIIPDALKIFPDTLIPPK